MVRERAHGGFSIFFFAEYGSYLFVLLRMLNLFCLNAFLSQPRRKMGFFALGVCVFGLYFGHIQAVFAAEVLAQNTQKSPNWHTNARTAHASADAVRGWVRFDTAHRATVQTVGVRGAQTLATTPGFRLYDPQGRIVPATRYVGQNFSAAWTVEKNTGKLHAIWLLNTDPQNPIILK